MSRRGSNMAFNAQYESKSGNIWYTTSLETKCSKLTQNKLIRIEKNEHGEMERKLNLCDSIWCVGNK